MLAVLCLGSGSSGGAWAAGAVTNAPEPGRWLLVVNTSSAMERRARATEGVLGELLVSGMNGQMKPGDEIGIWTFQKELQAGVAPLQTWEPAQSNRITGRTVNLLAQLPYKHEARLAPVLDELNSLVGTSRRLTVALFTDASGTFTNTPFDADLNAAIAQNAPALAKTRMPLVIILRAEFGKWIGQNVSLAPWPVKFPPFSPDPAPVAVATNLPPPVTAAAAPREIHISASKPKPEPIVDSTTPAAGTNSVATTNLTTELPKMAETNQVSTTIAGEKPILTASEATNIVKVAVAALEKPTESAPPSIQPAPSNIIHAPAKLPQQPAVQATPVPAVTAAPSPADGEGLNLVWVLVVGLGFLLAAAVIAVMIVRRSQRAQRGSFITQSFDRH